MSNESKGNDGKDKPDHERFVTIIVNGQAHEVPGKDITYGELANLAFDNSPPDGENVVITITYSKGEGGKQGTVPPGGSVKVKDGMVFNVTATDKS